MSIGAGIAVAAIWASLAWLYIKRPNDQNIDWSLMCFLGLILTSCVAH